MCALGVECDRGRHWEDLVSLVVTNHPPVVGDIANRKNSMACAIREAYAAALTVVILIDDQAYDD